MRPENPGSIRNQLGYALLAIRRATEDGDILRKADLYANTVTVCAPYLDVEQEATLRVLPPMPTRDRDGTGATRLNAAIETALSNLLRCMAQRNIYAYLPGSVGDAASLALTDEDEDADAYEDEDADEATVYGG